MSVKKNVNGYSELELLQMGQQTGTFGTNSQTKANPRGFSMGGSAQKKKNQTPNKSAKKGQSSGNLSTAAQSKNIMSNAKSSATIQVSNFNDGRKSIDTNQSFSKKSSKTPMKTRTIRASRDNVNFDDEILRSSAVNQNVKTRSFAGMRGREEPKPSADNGPGCYDVNETHTRYKSPEFTIGKKKKDKPIEVYESNYTEADPWGKGKASAFTSKPQERPSTSPGPGAYNENHSATRYRTPSATISKSQPKHQLEPDTHSNAQDPGNYDHGKKFGEGVKTFTIQKEGRRPQPDNHPAPGQYDAERSHSATKYRTPAATISAEPRKDNFAPSNSQSTLGPGNYDHGKKFGEGVKAAKINPPSPKIIKAPQVGPGEYNIDRADTHTKAKTKAAIISKEPRKDHFSPDKERTNVEHYDAGKKFGEGVKTFTISKEGRQPRPDNTPAPGQYNADRAESQTKHRNRAALISKEPRKDNFAPDKEKTNIEVYDTGKKFGEGAKTFTIAKEGRSPQRDNHPAPGQYDADRADSQTKHRTRAALISKEPRKDNFSPDKERTNVETYDTGKKFGEGAKTFTIAKEGNKPRPVNTPAPGQYNADRAESLTKHRNRSALISKEPRKNNFCPDKELANVEVYDTGKKFGDGAKTFTISKEGRQPRPDNTPAPGQYNADRAESVTKHRNRSALISKEPRKDNFSPTKERTNVETYDTGKKFGEGAKTFKIPKESRYPQPDNTPAPGQYDPDRAQSHTKARPKTAIISKEPRRDNFSPTKQSTNVDSYYYGKKFGEGVKSFSFAPESPRKAPSQTPAPGQYDFDPAKNMTKARSKAAIISKEPRRDNFSPKKERTNIGPGNYDDQKKFGQDVKSYTIAPPSPVRKPDLNPGPGHYQESNSITKSRSKAAIITKSPRRSNFKASGDSANLGPGAYSDNKNFGDDTKGFKIYKKPEKRPQQQTPAPGQYNHEAADAHTKAKTKSAIIYNEPRRDNFSPNKERTNVETYDTGKKFGEGVKTFTIPKEGRYPQPDNTPAPGQYNHEAADAHTKAKTKAAVIYNEPRRDNFSPSRHQDNVSSYDYGKKFGEGVKTFTISPEGRRPRHDNTPAPGQYNHEAADAHTKYKTKAAIINNEPRFDNFAPNKERTNVDTYDHGKPFGDGAKTFTFSPEGRRPQPDNTPAPGQYNHETADAHTKAKTKAAIINNEPRFDNFSPSKHQDNVDSYDYGKKFGEGVKTFTISPEGRRPQPDNTPAPGQYNHEAADAHTKAKTKAAIINNEPRFDNFAPNKERTNVDTYDHGKPFGEGARTFTISPEGRRPQPDNTPAPGQYNHEAADAHTKSKTKAAVINNEPRFDNFAPNKERTNVETYDHGKPFGYGAKTFTISPEGRRPQPDNTPAPGQYNHEAADAHTKSKTKAAIINNEPRFDNFSPNKERTNVDAYDHGKPFGEGAKTFTISPEGRRPQPDNTPAPGQYNHEAADAHTKSKTKAAIINNEPRFDNFAPNKERTNVDTYDHGKPFGDGAKTFTISPEGRRPQPDNTPAPGQYNHEIADAHTKAKAKAAIINNEPRRDNFSPNKERTNVDTYDHGKPFGEGARTFTISPEGRRPQPDNTPAPGQYNHEAADAHTKSKTKAAIINNEPRFDNFAPNKERTNVDTYDHGKPFGEGAKSFTISPEGRRPQPDNTPAPGQYNHEAADAHTKSKTKAAIINNEPRFDNFSPNKERTNVDAYDHGKPFGEGAKTFTISPEGRRPQPDSTPAPGQYNGELADAIRNYKTPSAVISKEPRFDNFAPNKERTNVDTYDHGKPFGEGAKTFTISPEGRRPQPDNTPAPGQYNHEAADAHTKSKAKAAIINNEPRRDNFSPSRHQDNVDSYDYGKKFGDDVKSFTIPPEGRRPQQDVTPAPGQYNHENADAHTKSKAKAAIINNEPRFDNFSPNKERTNVDAYDHGKPFGEGAKTFTISPEGRSPQPDNTPAPGQYNHEAADAHTKSKAKAAIINNEPRFDNFAPNKERTNVDTYDHGKPFGDGAKTFTISPEGRRPQPDNTPAPGQYNHEAADAHTKSKSKAAIINNEPRQDNFSPSRHQQNVDATIDHKNFGDDTKGFTIGQKRPDPNNGNQVGPGDYDPNHSQTKNRTPAVKISSTTYKNDTKYEGYEADDVQYNNFGNDVNGFTIGVKRDQNREDSPGPGHYDPEEKHTRHRSPEAVIHPEKVDYDAHFAAQQQQQQYERKTQIATYQKKSKKQSQQQVDVSADGSMSRSTIQHTKITTKSATYMSQVQQIQEEQPRTLNVQQQRY